MWEDEAFAQRCGERARRVAQSFSWRTIAQRHLDLYMELTGPGPALGGVSGRDMSAVVGVCDRRGPITSWRTERHKH